MKHHRTLKLSLAACAIVLVACAKGEQPATDTGAGLASPPPPAPPVTTPSLTDPNIVYILDMANAGDSARGKLASTKGTSAEVKEFGRLMMGEHHALRLAGENLARKLNVTPTPPAADDSESMAKAELDSLNAMPKGKEWDKRYIDYEVMYHQAVIDKANQAHAATQNAELKQLIESAAPIIKKHLEKAQEIQGKLQ